MRNSGHGLTAAALAAGGILIGLEFSGLTAAHIGFSVLECLCGILAGLGLAELWRRPRLSGSGKVYAVLLLLVHVFTLWLWLPFLAGLCGGKGRHRFRRSLALLILPGALLAGFWVMFQVLFPASPGFPAWYRGVPILLPCVFYGTVRCCWGAGRRESAGILLRLLLFYGFSGGAALLLQLIVWPAGPWYLYAAWGLGTAGCYAAAEYFPAARPRRRLLNWILAVCALPVTGCIWLNLRHDFINWGLQPQQQRDRALLQKAAQPVIRAAQEYRKIHGTWPEDPAKLVPDSPATGCFTEKDGQYRIVFQQKSIPAAWFWKAAPEGAGSWELHAVAHPLLPRSAPRFRHAFPATDEAVSPR